MQYNYSKQFIKDAAGLDADTKKRLLKIIDQIKEATTVNDIACKKLAGTKNAYRLRVGDCRATFVLIEESDKPFIGFQRILSRGEIYKKHIMDNLKK